jgi:leader peptidase (prepilin peptidase) / N-methyltransferase
MIQAPPDFVWPAFAFALGLIFGSFSNVCIHRLPLGQSVVHPRSRCPRCQSAIAAWDNIPLLSYLFLRGRCRVCGSGISIRYPLVEAANAFLYLGVALLHPPGPYALVTMAFLNALLVLALIDLDHQLLPDVITKPGIAAGLLASLGGGPPGWRESALSAAAGYLLLMAVARLWQRLRHIEALGQGDWKLVAMLGAFLGWQKLLLTILLATTSGTIVGLVLIAFKGRTFQEKLPLGTFLGFAGILVVFAGDPAVQWYARLLRV